MSETAKQMTIRKWFNIFAKLHPELQEKDFEIWEDTEHDPPDVCVGNYEIGIEFTEYVVGQHDFSRGSQVRAAEKDFDRITVDAKSEYEAAFNEPLNVSTSWYISANQNERPKRTDHKVLSQELVSLISAKRPITSSFQLHKADLRGKKLAPYVNFIHVSPTSPSTSSLWSRVDSGFATPFDSAVFSALVAEKTKGIDRYNHQFSEKWVVIVVQGFSPSSWTSFEQTIDPCDPGGFDAAFLLHIENNLCLEFRRKESDQ